MAVFGLPGGAELIVIAGVLLMLGLPTLVVAGVVWLIARNKRSVPGAVPAAWLADPTGRHEMRYWNGSVWTEHVADSGVQSTDPV